MYRIRDFVVMQSLPMRMLGLMELVLLTFDNNEPLLILKGIPQLDLAQYIHDCVQKSRQNNRVVTVDK